MWKSVNVDRESSNAKMRQFHDDRVHSSIVCVLSKMHLDSFSESLQNRQYPFLHNFVGLPNMT